MMRYAELRCKSAFSFLQGASDPQDLVDVAAELGLSAVALADVDGVYGAPRFYKAAREVGLHPIVGADLTLEGGGRLLVLVKSRTGYKNLCRLISLGHRDRPKGESALALSHVTEHAEGLLCLTGGVLERALQSGQASLLLDQLNEGFGPQGVWVELCRHFEPSEAEKKDALLEWAQRKKLGVVATQDVRYARREQRRVLDVFTCLRHKVRLDSAGRLLLPNTERHLLSPQEMAKRFCSLPEALENTLQVAHLCAFTLDDLGYRFPDFPVPSNETQFGFLHRLVQEGARWRYRPLTPTHAEQIAKELSVIAKLDLAGYFLVVWDIVRFCREVGILAQGRGSAANSAVCYSLGITAVDPIGMGMLFERFLSEERGQWPDIDLDLPSGERREAVIQYVYQSYGRLGAAMTANVITFRDKSALREVGKVLGLSEERLNQMLILSRSAGKPFCEVASEAGLDPQNTRVRYLVELIDQIQHLPRHLGQHSGGMVIVKGRLDEVVPLEPASMPGRTVIQWDKDDCADMGIIKVDLLGLGMLKALEEAVPLVKAHEGVDIDLAHLPQDDPKVYAMLQRADTVGVFQVESRAQMATLPRLRPRCFYDLVIEVALIRPGPIVGQMVHPYLNRRQGREEVTYPHPSLKPILERTLGVPLFQEQVMRIAMVSAGFSAGQAEELRRAMTHKRSPERMAKMAEALRSGMAQRGIVGEKAEEIVHAIASFALYGFPESHAASFALIVYASAYLKAHHPAAFYCSLLNAWPMGFYHPASLVKDAQRHRQAVHPIDINRSSWFCRVETDRAIRLGLRFVTGLRREAGRRIEAQQRKGAFQSLHDVQQRCRLHENELHTLAELGAFAGLGLRCREALWQVLTLETEGRGLLARLPPPVDRSPLPEMTALERTAADLKNSGITTGPHPLSHWRAQLRKKSVIPAASLAKLPNGQRVSVAGFVITRQRPHTAKGFCFLTLEDETGLANVVVSPDRFEANRPLLVCAGALIVSGKLQHRDGVIHLRGEHFSLLDEGDAVSIPSRDFH